MFCNFTLLFFSTKSGQTTSTVGPAASCRPDSKNRQDTKLDECCCVRKRYQRAESSRSADGSTHQSARHSGQEGEQSPAGPSYRYDTFSTPPVQRHTHIQFSTRALIIREEERKKCSNQLLALLQFSTQQNLT